MRSILALLVASFTLLAAPAAAQTAYPARPVHILVPYAPGGPADIAARLVGAKLTEALGQQVVVENRPGGRGYVAMTAAAKAMTDRTLCVRAVNNRGAFGRWVFLEVADPTMHLCPFARS